MNKIAATSIHDFLGTVVRASGFGPKGPWFEPHLCTLRCCLEQVTFTPCLGHLSQEAVDRQPTWTDFFEAGDYFVPNVCSPRNLVARPDNMDETVPHTHTHTHTHTHMIKTIQKSVSPEPLDRFEETCYLAIWTTSYHNLFKC